MNNSGYCISLQAPGAMLRGLLLDDVYFVGLRCA